MKKILTIKKFKFFLAMFLLLSMVFISTSDAILWFLAGVVRAGVVAVTTFVSTPFGKTIFRSAANHVVVGGLAYWYLDRGATPPPAERYIKVTLTGTKAVVQSMKNEGKVLSSDPSGGWATSVTVTYGNLDCMGFCCYERHTPVPAGSVMCGTRTLSCGGGTDYRSAPTVRYTLDVCCGVSSSLVYNVCNTTQKSAWSLDGAVETIFADPSLTGRAQDALGTDIQAGGTLVATPVSGEPVSVIGADGVSKEWPIDYSEQDAAAWLDNTPSYVSPSVTATDIKTAVGEAITEKLGDSTLPSDPSFDSGVPGDQPIETDYKSLLTDFFNTHPLRAITQTAQITTSGAVCSVSGDVNGQTLTFSFCELESLLHLLGIAFVLICTVRSFFIAMGVGE